MVADLVVSLLLTNCTRFFLSLNTVRHLKLLLFPLVVILLYAITVKHYKANRIVVTPSDLHQHDIQNIHYNAIGPNSDRAVFVVPRRSYYFATSHVAAESTILIVAEVHDDAISTIIACELNGQFSTSVHLVEDYYLASWVKDQMPGTFTHRVLLVHCLGFSKSIMKSGSFVHLIYMKQGEQYYSRVKTEKPLVIPPKESNLNVPSHGKGSIVVCTIAYGRPDYFEDWLRYQKTLGVDLVHINADVSFQQDLYPFLKQSLKTGFVRMDVWNHTVGERFFYQGQIMKYQDCLYRYKGIFEYGMFLDIDDFFIPMLDDHKDIHYYFDLFFGVFTTATCFRWRHMHCKPRDELHKTLKDGNLTKILSGRRSSLMVEYKCAYRLSQTEVVSIHMPDRLLSGHQQLALWWKAYVAHNKVSVQELCIG